LNGLIVKQAGRPQQVISSYIRMILSYRYGMDIMIAADVVDASALLREKHQDIRAVFIVQSQAIPSRTTIPALGNQGQHPLFMLLPRRLADDHNNQYGGSRNVFILPWEGAFGKGETSLKMAIERAFAQNRIEPLLGDTSLDVPYQVLQQKVEKQVANLDTLPDIVLQIL
jgi:hypothetical protein